MQIHILIRHSLQLNMECAMIRIFLLCIFWAEVCAEAEVILDKTLPSGNANTGTLCEKPIEDHEIFKDCSAPNDQSFPAHGAMCSCVKCNYDYSLQLECNEDGKWYSLMPNICDPHNAKYRCGNEFCTMEKLVDYKNVLLCDNSKIPHEINCHCKTNCLKVEVKCNTSAGWDVDISMCTSGKGFMKVDDAGLKMESSMGLFRYSCMEGKILQGPQERRCLNGVLDGDEPFCRTAAPSPKFIKADGCWTRSQPTILILYLLWFLLNTCV